MRLAPSPAEKFWLGLAAYILAADVYLWRNRKDTLSIQFSKWLGTNHGKLTCYAATAGIIGHLYVGIPLPMQKMARRHLGGIKEVIIIVGEETC